MNSNIYSACVSCIIFCIFQFSCLIVFHREEGIFALQEAIRLAQQHNNSLLLEYALVQHIVCTLHMIVHVHVCV